MDYTPPEDQRHYHGKAVVAFLDILGYSAFVKRVWEDDWLQVAQLVNGINGFVNKAGPNPTSERAGGSTTYRPRVDVISDTIVLCFPTADAEDHFSGAVISTLHVAAQVWVWLLDKGLTLRGGIEYGEAYWDATVTTGPALVYAHELEAGPADWSRVILGPQLVEACGRELPRYALDEVHGGGVRELVAEDSDGLLMLEPKAMGSIYREIGLDSKGELEERSVIGHVLHLMRQYPHSRKKYGPLYRQLTREGVGITPERFAAIAKNYGNRFPEAKSHGSEPPIPPSEGAGGS